MPDPGMMREQQTPSTPALIKMAPEGDKALALINNDIYVVMVPYLGEAPTISVASPDGAAFPAQKLTEIGGQFPAWAADGRNVHWSIGNGHFIYNLDEAKAFADSIKAVRKAEEEAEKEEDDEEEKEDTFDPDEYRIEVEFERDIPESSILLRNARIITMKGDTVITRGDILIENNRIAVVGEAGSIEIQNGTEEKDLSGKTVIPGFVDTHAHMWPSWGIHKHDVWMYAANLAYGVTTTRDPQKATTDVLTYGDLVEAGNEPENELPGIIGQ